MAHTRTARRAFSFVTLQAICMHLQSVLFRRDWCKISRPSPPGVMHSVRCGLPIAARVATEQAAQCVLRELAPPRSMASSNTPPPPTTPRNVRPSTRLPEAGMGGGEGGEAAPPTRLGCTPSVTTNMSHATCHMPMHTCACACTCLCHDTHNETLRRDPPARRRTPRRTLRVSTAPRAAATALVHSSTL